ncbi:MAG: alpha/beta hydrolase, partial [Alphaproteobacteria bacterium]|nr:alpha/beta hydrolase [Alphaproteobacteria bacterium]
MLILRYASIGALLAYFFVAGYLYSFQDSFVFKPRGELARPAETGLSGVSAETVAMADGVLVTVWTAPPAIPDMPTVLFLHGNLG